MSETGAAAIREIADLVWAHVADTSPYFALRAGLPVQGLPRGSVEEARRDAAVGRVVRERLRGIDVGELPPVERDTVALLEYFAQEWCQAEESWWWHFPVAPYQAYELASHAPKAFGSIGFDGNGDRDTASSDVERYLELARDIAGWVEVAKDKVARQVERGWALPRDALPGFVAVVRGLRATVPQWLAIDDARAGRLDAAKRTALLDRLERIQRDEIMPAFDRLLGYLTGSAEDTAVDGVGLSQYPGGKEAYRQLVRSYATFDVTPEEVHPLGLEQVAQLTEQLAAVRAEVGFTGGEREYRQVLEADPRFHARCADDVAATYRQHLAAVEPLLDQWFAITPAAEYGLERLDETLEATMSYGNYEPPTPQEPVGRYRYNGSGLDTRSQINAAALILHELVPGHHFHLARQAEDKRLHPVRAELAPMLLGAYTEGWAEYAASLGDEMGVYADPWDRYGYYLHQRFTAQRLVVDTGLNAFGWSLGKAREYMTATTMESQEQVRTETLRYSTDMPGQALGYRLGCLKLWELRRRASEELGAAFDARDFHEVVLGSGALPLTAVEENVTRFTERTSS